MDNIHIIGDKITFLCMSSRSLYAVFYLNILAEIGMLICSITLLFVSPQLRRFASRSLDKMFID